MIVVVISYMFSLTLFLCTLIIHSPFGALVRSSPEVVRSQVFTRLRVLKERKCKKKKQRWSRGHKARGQGQKKIRGQGQGEPFRGQTLSRPRTRMLEAKDQGHKRKCSPKKRLFKNFFQAFSKKEKKRSSKFFSGVLQ